MIKIQEFGAISENSTPGEASLPVALDDFQLSEVVGGRGPVGGWSGESIADGPVGGW